MALDLTYFWKVMRCIQPETDGRNTVKDTDGRKRHEVRATRVCKTPHFPFERAHVTLLHEGSVQESE